MIVRHRSRKQQAASISTGIKGFLATAQLRTKISLSEQYGEAQPAAEQAAAYG
jgi:hypothetical protein